MDDSSDFENLDIAERVLASFERLHGSLVEFYVFHADLHDWARVLSRLESGGQLLSLTLEGEEIEPRITSTVFDDPDFDPYLLSAHIAGSLWTSRLTDSMVIDMQGDPREFTGRDQVADLLEFLGSLSEVLGKEVILIPESSDPRAVTPLAKLTPVSEGATDEASSVRDASS